MDDKSVFVRLEENERPAIWTTLLYFGLVAWAKSQGTNTNPTTSFAICDSQPRELNLWASSNTLEMLFFRSVSISLEYTHWIATDLTLGNSFFKTLVDHEVTVELKNDIQIRGTLKSVDQYLNIKLDDIQVVEELKYPHLVSARDSTD